MRCQPCLVHVVLQVKALRQLLIGRRYLGTSDNTAMVLASLPIPSISVTTVCPSRRYCACPTPPGVPVAMTSLGLSVMTAEMYSRPAALD